MSTLLQANHKNGSQLVSRIRKGLALTTIAAFMVWGLGASSTGCSSDDVAATPDAAVAQDCPKTVLLAQGTTCREEALLCVIGYECGQFLNESARCTCTAGKFDCVDPHGAAIEDPAKPKCTSPGSGNKDCPASQSAAEGASCKTPGQQCAFEGFTCSGNTSKNTDICFCTGGTPENDAAVPLIYRCEIKGCTPPSDGSIPKPDASKSDSAIPDAGSGG